MKTTGLSFTGEMVRALLANRKFQTRRIVKIEHRAVQSSDDGQWYDADGIKPGRLLTLPNAPGDVLYVKECYRTIYDPATCREGALDIDYKADGIERIGDKIGTLTWKSGRFMPRWAARIWLGVTACRFEWLQDISAFDAIKEGIDIKNMGHPATKECNDRVPEVCVFQGLWDRINAKRGPWSSNPLVVVREFRRIEKPPL